MLKKIISILFIIILLITWSSNVTYATIDETISKAENFLVAGGGDIPINEDALQNTSFVLYRVLFAIAIVIAFAIGMVIGIQFIFGSVEDQAKVKETLIPYVIGVFVVFASFTIWRIVVNIGNKVTNEKQVAQEAEELSQAQEEVKNYEHLFITKQEFNSKRDAAKGQYEIDLINAIKNVTYEYTRERLQQQYELIYDHRYEY